MLHNFITQMTAKSHDRIKKHRRLTTKHLTFSISQMFSTIINKTTSYTQKASAN